MSDSDAMREAAREVLRELLPDMLRDALAPAAAANGNGHAEPGEPEPVPQVPAPPVAAVLRPSTWAAPPAPGEIVGENSVHTREISQEAPGGERVTIESDEELNSFVRALAARLESPRERRAIRAGQVRFTLSRAPRAPGESAGRPALRIDKGAVTERTVRQAAAEGLRIVAARGAVITPLARDQARTLGVEIEKERTC